MSTLSDRLNDLTGAHQSLAERVAALEAKNAVAADARPAWQRAGVGDMVWHKTRGFCEVTHIAEVHNGFRLGLGGRPDGWIGWTKNEEIVTIAAPEPETPKDETAPMCSTSTCPNYGSACFEECPDWPGAEVAQEWGCSVCDSSWETRDQARTCCSSQKQATPSPASLDALKAEATDGYGELWRSIFAWRIDTDNSSIVDDEIAALLDRAHALGLSGRPDTHFRISHEYADSRMEDVRERAIEIIDAARAYGFGFPSSEFVAERLASAGLLASKPETVTRKQIFSFLNDHEAADDGTQVAHIFARNFPNLVIEGE